MNAWISVLAATCHSIFLRWGFPWRTCLASLTFDDLGHGHHDLDVMWAVWRRSLQHTEICCSVESDRSARPCKGCELVSLLVLSLICCPGHQCRGNSHYGPMHKLLWLTFIELYSVSVFWECHFKPVGELVSLAADSFGCIMWMWHF